MKTSMLWLACAALSGCGGISYKEGTPAVAGLVWVDAPEMKQTHREIDKPRLGSDIRVYAEASIRKAGFKLAAGPSTADIVIAPVIEEFFIGTEATRFLRWAVDRNDYEQPWYRMVVRIRIPGHALNEAEISRVIEVDGYDMETAATKRARALLDDIARVLTEIVKDHER